MVVDDDERRSVRPQPPAFLRAAAAPAGGRVLISLTDPADRERWQSCIATLQSAGCLVHASDGLEQAVLDLAAGSYEVAVFVVPEGRPFDRRLGELLSHIPELAPVVLAGVPSGSMARGLIVAGAYDTIENPLDAESLERAVARAVGYCRALRREARFDPREPLSRLLGASDAIKEVERLVGRAAVSPSPVLVIGEPGSGKHIVAQAVHAHPKGARRSGPFVKCLVGGIEPARLGEELYGTASRPGPFELADGGTLFLEDVAQLPRADQARLLEILKLGPRATIARWDDSATVPADLRLVAGVSAGTDEPLPQGLLRDLDYRITVLPIRLPPLRRRVADIPMVAGALVDRYASLMRKTVVGISPRATAILQRYAWPGNIRELEEHVERAVRHASGPVIEAEDLAGLARMTAGRPDAAPAGTLEVSLSLDESLPLAEIGRRAAAAAEMAAIRRALKITGGNVTQAAKLLEVSRIHLQKRMKRYGLRDGR